MNLNRMPLLQPIQLSFWQKGWFQILLLTISGMAILLSLRLMAQAALHRNERRLLQQERARIAREIHDDIGARMTQLVLHGEVAQCSVADGSEAQGKLMQICSEARGLLSTMDDILWAVNPSRDNLTDFSVYVCNYAQEYLESTTIQCLFEVDDDMSEATFNLPHRRSLLMAIKETLNNAVKHSAATELRFKLQRPEGRLVVVVQDNGKGFDPTAVDLKHHGLTNMAQRMRELGGRCRITSQPGQGCRVEFDIPLQNPRRGMWAWIWNTAPILESKDEISSVLSSEPQTKPNHDSAKH
jgi:signal transduction histidine kinase